jgi:hypothetical protein
MKSLRRNVVSFADRLADELRILSLYYDDPKFYDDPLGGKYRTIGRWNLQPRYPLSICVYAGDYFESRHDCWVGFGARNAPSVELVKKEMSAGSFVELSLEDWKAGWNSLDKARQDALTRTSFTVFEDWRPRGWTWLGRYFRSDQIDEAIEFLQKVIRRPRSGSIASDDDRKTEASGKTKVRIGQGDFRSEVVERWGRACALTGFDVVDVLEAAHIASWAHNTKERRSAENGLLLSPNVHKLMEEGLISFADDGSLRTKLSIERLERLGLRENMELSLPLTKRQLGWMKEHRKKHGLEETPNSHRVRHRT